MKGRVIAGTAATVLMTLASVAPAHAATTISSGHVDAVDVDWTGTALTLDLRDGTVTPAVWFDSGNGLPDNRAFPVNTHAHANWAFEAAGTYTVVFEATGTTAAGAAVSTGQETYTFTVQP